MNHPFNHKNLYYFTNNTIKTNDKVTLIMKCIIMI